MTTKAKGTSIAAKLSTLSKKAGISYRDLSTSFLIERLVQRLVSDKKLKPSLVFKGGFVALRVYNSPRYTIDLDALLLKSNLDATLELAKKAAEHDLGDGVWFRFIEQIKLATQGEYGGIRQVFRAGIGEIPKDILRAQIINFDLGIGDPVTPGPLSVETPGLISDEELSWSVYPIETAIAEKLHAMVSRGDANSRSKDIFDLTLFLPKAEPKALRTALRNSFKHRETDLPESFSDLLKELDTDRLQKGWARAVSSIPNAPKFHEAFAELKSLLSKFEQKV